MLLSEMAPMVWPSMGAFLSATMAMRPPAPGRLSTMTFWPVALARPCPIARTMTSSPSPGAPAVISVIGFVGQACALSGGRPSPSGAIGTHFQNFMAPSSSNTDHDFPQLPVGVHVLVRRLHFLERENPVDERPHCAACDGRHQVFGKAPRGLRTLLGRAQAVAHAKKLQPAHREPIHVELDLRRAAHLPDGGVAAVDGERIQDLVEERRAYSIDGEVRSLPLRRLLHRGGEIRRRGMDAQVEACGLALRELFR